MSGAIPPLPQYAFMAWYSVKAQGQLYLYLTCETTELYRTGSRGHVFRMTDSHSAKKVKVKLFLCLTKHHTMKAYWGMEV
jgi:hypothetical protein